VPHQSPRSASTGATHETGLAVHPTTQTLPRANRAWRKEQVLPALFAMLKNKSCVFQGNWSVLLARHAKRFAED